MNKLLRKRFLLKKNGGKNQWRSKTYSRPSVQRSFLHDFLQTNSHQPRCLITPTTETGFLPEEREAADRPSEPTFLLSAMIANRCLGLILQMPGYGFKALHINRNTQNLQRLFSDFKQYSALKGKKKRTNLYISNPQTICSK